MPLYTSRYGQPWGDRLTLNRAGWGSASIGQPVIAHGAYAFTGPLGSGKSILASKFLYEYTKDGAIIDPATGRCICGKEDCQAKWRVFTNMPSTWEWAEPIDIAIQLTESFSEIDHAVIGIDEAHQVLEARRAMRNVNVDASYFLTHLRKRSCKLFFTSPSIDYVDARLRDRTTRVYNVWTFNGGRTVHADVWNFAMGHLPPAMRYNQRPQHKWWPTEYVKKLYDSWERITNEDVFANREMRVNIRDNDGMIISATVEDLTLREIEDMAREGKDTVTPEAVAMRMTEKYKFDIAGGLVRRYLMESGYPARYTADGSQEFTILVEVPA
jgi:hypothetical protein